MQAEDLAFDVSDTSTPSPAATTGPSANTPGNSQSGQSSSASRRPPRKSTLTQQQKNQKRQRATQDQLVTLELEFKKNPTPTAATRERIAQEINMTERSVQIWFQNSRRRAKIKMLANKGLDNAEDCESIPEPMRQILAMQGLDASKAFPRHLMGRPQGPPAQFSGGMMPNGDPNGTGKVVIQHFTCRSLTIGSWRRVGQNAMDLVIFYSPDKACITYYINNDSAGYKIEFPFAYIKNITLETGEPAPNNNGAPPRPGGLVIELTRPPHFFMDSSGSGGFYQCGDFTEDQQASQLLTHYLGGHPKVLAGQLAKLVSLDSFQNRHNPFDANALSASAPVSPTLGIVRPASQPNIQFARPQPHIGMYQENHSGAAGHLRAGPPPPGHKRQRSRSVPLPVDFSVLHGPMPTFHIQQPSPQGPPDPNVFHPVPQHPLQGPIGPNLQIDTSSGYNLDIRPPYPVSATASEASDYASPGFFGPPPTTTTMPPGDFNTPYSMPYLSPSPMIDPSTMGPPSVSPIPQMGHADPIIADQSPPLSGMHRRASADMFGLSHDHGFTDDSIMLSEMYSKQNLNLPVPNTNMDDGSLLAMSDMSAYHTPRETVDDLSLMPYGTVDPNALQTGQPH